MFKVALACPPARVSHLTSPREDSLLCLPHIVPFLAHACFAKDGGATRACRNVQEFTLVLDLFAPTALLAPTWRTGGGVRRGGHDALDAHVESRIVDHRAGKKLALWPLKMAPCALDNFPHKLLPSPPGQLLPPLVALTSTTATTATTTCQRHQPKSTAHDATCKRRKIGVGLVPQPPRHALVQRHQPVCPHPQHLQDIHHVDGKGLVCRVQAIGAHAGVDQGRKLHQVVQAGGNRTGTGREDHRLKVAHLVQHVADGRCIGLCLFCVHVHAHALPAPRHTPRCPLAFLLCQHPRDLGTPPAVHVHQPHWALQEDGQDVAQLLHVGAKCVYCAQTAGHAVEQHKGVGVPIL